MNLGQAQIIQGNALALPLPDNSVDAVVTSPPYFGLRSYQDAGVHYDGQIGSEATPQEFLNALLAATKEMVRVLKPSGSIFVNLGDKYSGGFGGSDPKSPGRLNANGYIPPGGRAKSLMGIPWRYALRCIDQLGLILRAEIIWAKPNGLPESVTDRVRRSHEQWFHFTLQPRYFAAVDEIREAQVGGVITSGQAKRGRGFGGDSLESGTFSKDGGFNAYREQNGIAYNPLGKLPGSVWTIPTQPLTIPPELGIDHFAAYPMEWPRRIIQGWTPNGICVVCGEGRRPAVGFSGPHQMAPIRVLTPRQTEEWSARFADWCRTNGVTRRALAEASATGDMGARWLGVGGMPSVPNPDHWVLLRNAWPTIPPWFDEYVHATELRPVRGGNYTDKGGARKGPVGFVEKAPPAKMLTGYVCGCPTPTAPTTPAVVLDPFGGTGTTALVAKALGRTGITIDLSADYCRLAEWRCNDPRELAAALQVEKPEPVHPDQLDLFSEAP